jgi:protein-S-isoprenylcysteine O-methyltransferase Ste14
MPLRSIRARPRPDSRQGDIVGGSWSRPGVKKSGPQPAQESSLLPLRGWLASTPNRTFVLYPVLLCVLDLAFGRGHLAVNWWSAPLLVLGYLQYRLTGRYRRRLGGGGPGTAVPPVRLVVSGPYRHMRNPMYLGHLIFLLGLALTLRSWAGLALFFIQANWFDRRVRQDEFRLGELFGADYFAYLCRVPRWVPRAT